ncbi:MFS transporter [Kaistia algarum]|uniref:MFS transporter n=1 Tax=Kaistia algarum TaxID=2083279 RepID=UPI000CE72172|nr:MFS transporter [Kaistia algarum]MCX5513319.1 MFS transporter [Kaistia algarum]PPE81228.1 MFS transporter [Kaistia algarum]
MSDARKRLTTISALGMVQIFAWGSSFYLPAVLSKPIAVDTGWSSSCVSGGISVGLLASGIVSPRVGHLIRHHGGKPVLMTGVLMLALGLGIVGAAASLPVYLFGWLVLGCGMGASLYDAAFGTLGRYYGYGARDAITTLTLFGGFASTICWPLSAFLLAHGGWREVCFFYAALHIGFCLPLLYAFLPRVERYAPASGPSKAGSPARIDPRLRSAFWLLALILTTGGTIATIVSIHLLTILQARDASLAAAVSLGALIGPSQVGSRVLDMAIGKRLPAIATLSAAAGLIAAGILALASGLPVLALSLVLYGAGNGIWSIARGALPLALFGPDLFPVMMGRLAMPNLLAQSLAPTASALLIEQAGAARLVTLLAVAAVANMGLVAVLWRMTTRRAFQGTATAVAAPK